MPRRAGTRPDDAALGMTPVPANLVPTTQQWTAAKIHWVVKHGIKMDGHARMALSHERRRDLRSGRLRQGAAAVPVRRASSRPCWPTPRPRRAEMRARSMRPLPTATRAQARRAIDQYACATSHVIPGIHRCDSPRRAAVDRNCESNLSRRRTPNTTQKSGPLDHAAAARAPDQRQCLTCESGKRMRGTSRLISETLRSIDAAPGGKASVPLGFSDGF
jgi:hypothetical protein